MCHSNCNVCHASHHLDSKVCMIIIVMFALLCHHFGGKVCMMVVVMFALLDTIYVARCV